MTPKQVVSVTRHQPPALLRACSPQCEVQNDFVAASSAAKLQPQAPLSFKTILFVLFVHLPLCPNVCPAFHPSSPPRLVSTPLSQRHACGFRLGFKWPRYCRWYQRFVCCAAGQRRPLFPLVSQPHREQHQRVRTAPPSCAAKL